MKQFDDVVENGAERIMRQWEGESAHRRQIELIDARAFARRDIWGRIFAFALVVLALGVAALAVAYDQPRVAAILGGGTIASVVWAFMRTHRDGSSA